MSKVPRISQLWKFEWSRRNFLYFQKNSASRRSRYGNLAWRRKILTLFPNHWLQACRKNICYNLIMAHSISTRLQALQTLVDIREKKLPICGHIHKILHGHVNSKPLVRIQPWKTIRTLYNKRITVSRPKQF